MPMRIKSVRLKYFKRFTDTTISNIPESAKLVIIAGPNGCGKSSFFDGLNVWSRVRHFYSPWDETYFAKKVASRAVSSFEEAINIDFHGEMETVDRRSAIYIRSAHRNDPEFQLQSLARLGPAFEENRLERLISNDAAVSKNYQRLASQALEDMFELASESMTIAEFRDSVIGEIREATKRLFPDLVMNSLGSPLSEGTFRFDKGNSTSFGYQNLSAGEKSAFDLILDLVVKRREFKQAVFCIDEPEAHMNSKLQGSLLKELYDLIPDSSQLWLATHSAGMMRRARDLEAANPGTVVFLDFGGRNFDVRSDIKPEPISRAFWARVFKVAFDDFADLMAPKEIIVCEGSRIGDSGKNSGMDAKIYEAIFELEYPDTRFIPGGNCHDVESDRIALVAAMNTLVRGTTVRRLIDLDDRSESEVLECRAKNISVLGRRNLESYLYDDEVILRIYDDQDKLSLFKNYQIYKINEMDKAVARGKSSDDLKSIAGPLTARIRQDLHLNQFGNTPKAFALSIIAPRVYGTKAYHDLEASIFTGK